MLSTNIRGLRCAARSYHRMSISVSWANEQQTIIRLKYGPAWTWEDWLNADRQAMAMLDAAHTPVDLLHDARDTVMPNNTLSVLPGILRQTSGIKHPNAGLMIVVGAEPFLEIVVSVFKRAYSHHAQQILLSPTMESACALMGVSEPLPSTGSLG